MRRAVAWLGLGLVWVVSCGHDELLHMGDSGTAQVGTGGTIDAGGTGGTVTGHAASGGADASKDAPATDADAAPDAALADAAVDADGAPLDVTDAATIAPDFSLVDQNPSSTTYQQAVSPRDYLGKVSAWYFGSAT